MNAMVNESERIPEDVREFLKRNEAEQYLSAVIDAARQSFPGTEIAVYLHQDWEIEELWQVFVEVRGLRMTPDESAKAGRAYGTLLLKHVPGPKAVLFCLRKEWAE